MRFMMLMIPKGYEKTKPGTCKRRACYWRSMAYILLQWARASRLPAGRRSWIEVRQVQEFADFPPMFRKSPRV